MPIRKALLIPLVLMSVLAYAQREGVGGTGGAGGMMGFQGGTPHLVIITNGLPDATANTAYSQTMSAVNGKTPLTWSILFGTLPPGLTLTSATGAITGTPTTPGSYVFTVLVTDSTSPTAQTATQQLSISVNCPVLHILSLTPLPGGTKGTAYSFQFQSQGGLGTVAWSAGAGLPTGVTISSAGLLSGTPSVSGTFTFNVVATDSCPTPQTVVQPYVLQISSPVTIVTTSPLPAGVAGVGYSTQMAAQGGTAPYTWLATVGTFQSGLVMNTAGVISGTPTVASTVAVTIQVTDAGGNTNSAQFTLTTTCPTLSIVTGTTLPNGTQGTPYSVQMQASGGYGSLTWSGSLLPAGLTINSAGLVSGTPTVSGVFSPSLQVTDSCSPSQQSIGNTFSITLAGALTITTSSLPGAVEGVPYSAQIAVTGGNPPYTWSVPAGPVPAGAVDLLDWALMPLPARNNFHLTGPGLIKSFHLDGGLFWWLKNTPGNPWDGNTYDANDLYLWFTEDGDAADQPACIREGYTSCFVNPFASKTFVTPVPLAPRYFVPNSSPVTILTPSVLSSSSTLNPYVRTTNCGTDNQPLLYLGNIKTVTSGPTNVSYGGTIGTLPTIEVDYYYSGNVSGVYQSLEKYYLAQGFGQVEWQLFSWNGSSYTLVQTSLTNTEVAGGAPTPNFGCKVPTLPVAGGLPPGVISTSSPELNLSDSTGAISGTPSVAGNSSVVFQVEDSTGTIVQQTLPMSVTCPSISMVSTSPVPNGTQGQPYSYQFVSSGGISPVSWHLIAGVLPTGMTLSFTGILSGTPVNFGTFNFTAQAVDSCNPSPQSVQLPFAVTIVANSGALTITTGSTLPAGTEGVAYNAQLTATGGTPPYVWSQASGTPPAGVTLSTGGLLSGTPTTAGTTSFTARVTDAISTTTTKVLSTTISCPSFSDTSTSPLPAATQNQAYSFQFNSNGGISPITWSATGVPAGMTLSPSGLLSGSPTGTGTVSIAVTATDSCNPTPQSVGPTSFSLTISAQIPPIAITTTSPLPAGTEGVAYNQSMSATGGVPPYAWSLASGSFPAGLGIGSTGAITGTPTATGTTAPNIRVTDSSLATTATVFSITVSCPTFTVPATTLPNGTQNSPYSFQFTSNGGVGPITWTGTSIPAGLTLTTGGLLSGTPTGTGTFTPAITATDSCNPTPQVIGPTSYSLVINPQSVPLQIITPSPLPPGTVGQPYSAQVAATGGTPPYSGWTVTSGSLPTGLSIASGTGIISGTPTTAQTTTPTIRVTDNVAATASKAFSITINAVSTADNRYCASNETVVNLPQDGPAKPLQACVNTALINTPAAGPVKTVCASGCDFTTVAAAVSGASCGWIIKVKSTSTGTPAGTQNSYSGNISPTLSCPKTNWVWVETDQVTGLPPEGSRATPGWIGTPSLPGRPAYAQPASPGIYMPKLVMTGGGPLINFGANASGWRFIGLELTTTSGANVAQIVVGPSAGNHAIFDRVLSHASNSATWQSRDNVQANFRFASGSYWALIDSYVGDTHCVAGSGTCTDSQNIFVGGSAATTSGPGKIVNNFLETSGESVFSGGGGQGAANVTGSAQDIEVRRNHFFKPLFWKVNDPSYFGTSFVVKNDLEWKNTVRSLIEGNIFDQNWGGAPSDQHGIPFIIGARNQNISTIGTASSNGTGTLTWISGQHFLSNVVSPQCAVPSQCLVKYNGLFTKAQTFIDSNHITVLPAPPTNASAAFNSCEPGLNPTAVASDVTFRYNLITHAERGFELAATLSDCNDLSLGDFRITIHDVSGDDINGPHWSTGTGECCFWSDGFQLANFQVAPKQLDSVLIHHVTLLPFGSAGQTPSNGGPIFGFAAQGIVGGGITHLQVYDNIAAAGLTTGNTAVCTGGSSALTLLQCWDKISGVAQNSFCFDHNVLATTTTGTVAGTGNNPPYPAAGQSPNCPFTTTGNPLPASYSFIQFTNLNGAIGGNYQLLPGSPFHNTASDGTDPGVNWPLLQTYIAGVQ